MSSVTITRGDSIGAVSRQTGVNIETVRYYERIGIMPKPDRTAGGNRQYNHNQVKRLFFIKRSRELGFSLKEITALLSMLDRNDISCAEVHQMTVLHLEQVRSKIQSLTRLETALSTMAAACSKGDVPDCPIVETLFEGQNVPPLNP